MVREGFHTTVNREEAHFLLGQVETNNKALGGGGKLISWTLSQILNRLFYPWDHLLLAVFSQT